MEYIYSLVQNPAILVGILMFNGLLIIGFLINNIVLTNKYKRLNTRYREFMSNLSGGEKVEEIMREYIKIVNEVSEKEKEMDCDIKRLEGNLKKCVQKVGLIRYNAYKDTGSDLSFTMALMDAEENGVVVNGLYSRESSSIFAKPLIKGETKYNLSAEEIQAIDIAKASSASRY